MTRAVVAILALSFAGAGLVALASRAPAELRNAEPLPDATDPSLGASFTDRQVERHGPIAAERTRLTARRSLSR